MGNSQHITTYQIDPSEVTQDRIQILLDGCRVMYPTKIIMASLEFNDIQMLVSVYATDQEN